MSIEAIAATSSAAMPPPAEVVGGPSATSITDVTSFQGSLSAVSMPTAGVGGIAPVGTSDQLSPAIKAMIGQIEKVNGEAKSVADSAQAAQLSGKDMTPGEVVNLTMRCHEFMFHCQLTSSIANRTSDGIQQLFRQQS